MVINVDVVTDSINTRLELSDLVYSYFGYHLQQKCFQFYGRSFFDRLICDEWFHISLNNQFNWTGEVNKPRQGGEQYEHIYAIRGSIPLFIEDFIDKSVQEEPVWVDSSNVESEAVAGSSELTGDYFKGSYK